MKFYNNQPRVEKVIAIFQNILIFWRVLIEIRRGVRQGCILSPTLFSRCTEDMFSDAECKRFKFNSRNVNHLGHADNTALVAGSMTALNTSLHTINDSRESLNMQTNAKKIKIMVIGKDILEDDPGIMINGNVFGKSWQFYISRTTVHNK